MPRAVPPLYAILDLEQAAARGLTPTDVCDAWLAAGVRLIQLRAKRLASGPFLELASRLAEMSRLAGARLLVNDRADIAALSGSDGVHLGQTDLEPAAVRRLVGTEAMIGLSTHNDAQVAEAVTTPVNYVAIGPVFSTSSKREPDPVVGLTGVSGAAARTKAAGLPLVAIGGITLGEARRVIEAGADAVAVIADLLRDDPARRAREFLAALAW